MAITTIRSDMTWEGKVGDILANTSEKKIKQTIKDMTGAVDVEILSVDSWDEDEDEAQRDYKKGKQPRTKKT